MGAGRPRRKQGVKHGVFSWLNMSMRCLGCGKKVGANGLTKHFSWSRKCEAAYLSAETNSVSVAPSSPIEDLLYERDVRAFVYNDISELYYFRYLGQAMIFVLRIMIEKWIAFMIGLVAPEIEEIVGDNLVAAQVVSLLRRRLNPFKGLETEPLVEAYAAKHRTAPKYHEIVLGEKAYWYNLDLLDFFTITMRYNHVARKHIVASSELWKTGELRKDRVILSSWTHGEAFKKSILSERCVDQPGAPIELRIGILTGYDEFEPLNALGAKRGDHKLGGHYGSIGNLPAEVRYQHEHMMLLGIGEDKHVQKFHPTRIFSGASPDTGDFIPELNKAFFSQYRDLRAKPPIIRVRALEPNPRLGGTAHAHPCTRLSHAPMHPCALCALQVPIGDDPGKWVECKLVVEVVRIQTDFVAKTKLGATAQSTSCKEFCPDCDYVKGARQPIRSHSLNPNSVPLLYYPCYYPCD
jgi:hypothetical protein